MDMQMDERSHHQLSLLDQWVAPTSPGGAQRDLLASERSASTPGLVGDRTRSPQGHSIAEPFTQTIQRQREAAHPSVFLCLGRAEIKQRQLLFGRSQGFCPKRHSANADSPLEAPIKQIFQARVHLHLPIGAGCKGAMPADFKMIAV